LFHLADRQIHCAEAEGLCRHLPTAGVAGHFYVIDDMADIPGRLMRHDEAKEEIQVEYRGEDEIHG
jgi:hypothetical protein